MNACEITVEEPASFSEELVAVYLDINFLAMKYELRYAIFCKK